MIPPSRRRRTREEERPRPAVRLWPAVAAFAAYAGCLFFGFVHDDTGLIRSLDGTDLSPTTGLYRAVSRISHGLDYELWGSNPFGFHLTNVLLHVVATLLVTEAITRLTRDARAALLGGLVFALHPVHVEAVVVAANRRDILALIFCLIGVIAWLRYGPTGRGLLITAIAYILGLLAKEVAAVALPVLLMVLRYAGLSPPDTSRVGGARRAALAYVTLGAIGFGAATWATGGFVPRFQPAQIGLSHSWQITHYRDVLANAAAAIPRAFENLVLGVRTSVDYPLVQSGHVMAILPGLAVVVVVAGAAMWLLRRWPPVGSGVAWSLITLLPYANLIPLSPYYFADRYLYVPSFGWCLVVGVVASSVMTSVTSRPRSAIVRVVIGGVLVAEGIWCWLRTTDWQSDTRLFTRAQARGLGTLLVYRQLGHMAAQDRRWKECVPWFEEASRLVPLTSDRVALGYDGTYQRLLAAATYQAGAIDAAVRTADTLASHFPDDPDANFLLGEAAWGRGDRVAAVRHLSIALAARPTWVRVIGELSWLRALSPEVEVRRPDEAVGLARRAVELQSPSSAWTLHMLAIALAEQGDLEEAGERAEDALVKARLEGRPDFLKRIEFETGLLRQGISLTEAASRGSISCASVPSDFFGDGRAGASFPWR